MKRKPRIVSGIVEEAAAKKRTEVQYPPPSSIPYAAPVKSKVDEVCSLIDDACSYCWRFADSEGRPWIDRENVEDKGGGVFLVRFRCPASAMFKHIAFEKMASEVCTKLHARLRYASRRGEERYANDIKLPYEEVAWVICIGELDSSGYGDEMEDGGSELCIDVQEEILGELTDESTAEEVDLRIAESLDNFV